jgi:putative ABC transport system permease protein
MNLSTALAFVRAKEVGLRKTVGASRNQLIGQFIGESLILITAAVIIATQIVWLLLPLFNSLMGLSLELNILENPSILLIIIGIIFITAVLAGAYPAFYLSSFSPAKVLKGDQRSGKAGLRKVLTVFQFGIATFLVIGTIIVFQQMSFMKNASLGFQREHVISFNATIELHRNYKTFKERLLQNDGIKAVTISNGVPGETVGHWQYIFPGQDRDPVSINTITTDDDYLDVLGLQLADGRKLSSEYKTDADFAYLINETAAREFYLDAPVGTAFQVNDGVHSEGKIVGVIKDFHIRSLQHKVDPLVIRLDHGNSYIVSIKLKPGDYQSTLKYIESEWKRITPDKAFAFTFLDESFDKLYRAEEKTGILMTTFSILAIIVACLGLTGLASFLTQQRKKEISIRKIHGASVGQVLALLSWDFIKLVIIGFLLIVPIAWYGVSSWLENFAYQVDISFAVFIIAGLVITVIALLTVGYHSYRASLSNPAQVLREG